MTKWNVWTIEAWRARVHQECKKLAIQISTGAIDGPDIADRLEQLIVTAADRRPEA